MEGVLFIPPNRLRRAPELVCTDCGRLFRPRRIGDGSEEVCDRCYEARFQPFPRRNGHKPLWDRSLIPTR